MSTPLVCRYTIFFFSAMLSPGLRLADDEGHVPPVDGQAQDRVAGALRPAGDVLLRRRVVGDDLEDLATLQIVDLRPSLEDGCRAVLPANVQGTVGAYGRGHGLPPARRAHGRPWCRWSGIVRSVARFHDDIV